MDVQSSPPSQEQKHKDAKEAGSRKKYGVPTGTPKQLLP
jgi:hypothetical protein